MSVDDLADQIGETITDKDEIKTQFAVGSVVSWFKTFKEQWTIEDVSYTIKVRSVSGDTLFWDNPTYGIWDTHKWGYGVVGSDYPSGDTWIFPVSGDGLN